ncbi:mechanosensitive ion channel family protein [Marinagarivorans algicola]|uniref:mechanosensitive ion channel family protein n=1 Tax=Marinagarivorans algicola TaxID=1513270 RepID=UPI003735039B
MIFFRILLILFIVISQSNIALSQEQIITSALQTSESNESQKKSDDNQSQKNEDEPILELSEVIPIDDLTHKWTSFIDNYLQRNNYESNIIKKIILSIIILFIGLGACLLNKLLISKVFKTTKDKLSEVGLSTSKYNFYFSLLRWVINTIIIFSMISVIGMAWGLPVDEWLSTPFFTSLATSSATIFIIIFIGSLLLEITLALVESAFLKWGGHSTSRINTLLPIAKNVIYIIFFVLFILMALSELGINVMPLLAGAGVVGFAIGFGAQTIIKDILTGFIIILEDLVQIGDIVCVANKTGVIEKISIRKIQLRDLGGIVYTVPFSEIDVVENLTKDFSYYLFEIGIAYREDTDEVVKILKEVDEDIRSDSEFNKSILEPLEVFGVDQFADSAVIIKARIKTSPLKQWAVGREYNRRFKFAFDQNNIEIPFPHQTIYFGEDKKGHAPAMHLKHENSDQVTSKK